MMVRRFSSGKAQEIMPGIGEQVKRIELDRILI